jgi:hypothetical protein
MLVVQPVSTWKLPYHLLTSLNSIMAMSSDSEGFAWARGRAALP